MTIDPARPVRLAVVDDSSFLRQAIVKMMLDEPRIEVVGTAGSGEEFLARWEEIQPDVVTLDLAMPGIGGLATLDQIVARSATPVIILSTHSGQGAPHTLEALRHGAVDFIDKQAYSLLDFASLRSVLVERVVAVVDQAEGTEVPAVDRPARGPQAFDLLLIGASTGGPPAIEQLLSDLQGVCPVPCLVVQHMPEGFVNAFAQRLNSLLPFGVVTAREGGGLAPRTVHIGPSGQHLTVVWRKERWLLRLVEEPANHLHRPSVDALFESAARGPAERVLAVLLTGMGRDGARGLAQLRSEGAHTLVQDEKSSVVFGMPRAAIQLGAAMEVLPLRELGPRLRELLGGEVRAEA